MTTKNQTNKNAMSNPKTSPKKEKDVSSTKIADKKTKEQTNTKVSSKSK